MRNTLIMEDPPFGKEWDYEKNGDLRPEDFASASNKKAWWRCANGHSWQAAFSSRNSGRGCPYCTSRKLLPGFNDLLTIAPRLAMEWHHEKNGDLRPEDVLANSHKSVWWMCPRGHQWQEKISNRFRGSGCPYDMGKRMPSPLPVCL